MTDKAAIHGNYADLKYIKTRSVVQIVVEVPIERAHEITDAFGWTQPGKEIPVALARLNPAMVAIGDDEQPVEKPRRAFSDLPASQQAAMRCKDADFQAWCDDQDFASDSFATRQLSIPRLRRLPSGRLHRLG